MAQGGSQQEYRYNKVFKAMNTVLCRLCRSMRGKGSSAQELGKTNLTAPSTSLNFVTSMSTRGANFVVRIFC